jgi:hypothetical protein
MKQSLKFAHKAFAIVFAVFLLGLLAACSSNPNVSTSVSVGVGYGSGYGNPWHGSRYRAPVYVGPPAGSRPPSGRPRTRPATRR